MKRPAAALATVLALFTVAACDDGGKAGPTPGSPAATRATPSATPTYDQEAVNAGLVKADEVGKHMKEVQPLLFGLPQKRAPMCSLTSVKLDGDPDVLVRQFSNGAQPKDEVKYAQLFALYRDPKVAEAAFQKLTGKARSCPTKQHVPVRNIDKKNFLLEHEDTWKVTDDTVAGWTHARGTEVHTEPATQTKYNVYHFFYDYSMRGNAILVTVYWERTGPKGSAAPVTDRATALLTKQLQKLH